MYWRTAAGFVILWVACLTLVMCAITMLVSVRSPGAALAFLAVAAVLAPPMQELIASVRHVLAPARIAFFAAVTLLPIGLVILGIDWVAGLETQARRLGFQSAAQWGRAQDLRLDTPQALAAHDAAERQAAIGKQCADQRQRPPLACFEPAHQRAALDFANARLSPGDLEGIARDALVQQRKAYLAADRDCADLLDRIEEDALPVMLADREAVLAIAAALWARHLSRTELERLQARAKPGVSHLASRDGQGLEQRLATLAPAVEKELDAALQTWARHLVMSEPGWRTFLRGRTPLTQCKPAMQQEKS